MDSGGFGWIPSSPTGGIFAVLRSLYRQHFEPIEMNPGFGRIRCRVGFGWILVDFWTPEMESANPDFYCPCWGVAVGWVGCGVWVGVVW